MTRFCKVCCCSHNIKKFKKNRKISSLNINYFKNTFSDKIFNIGDFLCDAEYKKFLDRNLVTKIIIDLPEDTKNNNRYYILLI